MNNQQAGQVFQTRSLLSGFPSRLSWGVCLFFLGCGLLLGGIVFAALTSRTMQGFAVFGAMGIISGLVFVLVGCVIIVRSRSANLDSIQLPGANGTPSSVPQAGVPSQACYQPPTQTGYQPPPQTGHMPPPQAGYQTPPQAGYQPPPQAGYQQSPQAGYQQSPQAGYQHSPQDGYQPSLQAGYQPPLQAGYQPPPQAGYQQSPQDGYQPSPETGYQRIAVVNGNGCKLPDSQISQQPEQQIGQPAQYPSSTKPSAPQPERNENEVERLTSPEEQQPPPPSYDSLAGPQ